MRVEQASRPPVELLDLHEHPEERRARAGARICEDAAETARAGVLEAATVAAHREAHLGGLRLDAELTEEAKEVRVRAVVADDEAAVDREHAAVGRHDLVRVRVATESVLCLEEGHVALPLQHVGGSEPGNSRSHHCHGRPVHGTPSCLRAECSPRAGRSDGSDAVAPVDEQVHAADEASPGRTRGSTPPRRRRSASPKRRSAMLRRVTSSAASSRSPDAMSRSAMPSVSIPGPTQFARTPNRPSSAASAAHEALDRGLRPRRQAVAHGEPVGGRGGDGDDVAAPCAGRLRRGSKPGGAGARAARPRRSRPTSWSTAARNCAGSTRLRCSCGTVGPAACTTVWIPPNSAAAIRRRTHARPRRRRDRRRPRCAATAECFDVVDDGLRPRPRWLRYVSTTSLPRAASIRQIAAPRPPLPPVTSATPARSPKSSIEPRPRLVERVTPIPASPTRRSRDLPPRLGGPNTRHQSVTPTRLHDRPSHRRRGARTGRGSGTRW